MLIFIIQIAYGRNKDKNEEIKGQEEIFFQSAFNKKKSIFQPDPFRIPRADSVHKVCKCKQLTERNSAQHGRRDAAEEGSFRFLARSWSILGKFLNVTFSKLPELIRMAIDAISRTIDPG